MSLQSTQKSHQSAITSNTWAEPIGREKAATRTVALAKVLFCGFAALFVSTTGFNQRPCEACQRAIKEFKNGLTTEQYHQKFAAENGFKRNRV